MRRPMEKNRKYPTSVKFTVEAFVLKWSVICGTAGVYISSDNGVIRLATTNSISRPNMPKRGCGAISQLFNFFMKLPKL